MVTSSGLTSDYLIRCVGNRVKNFRDDEMGEIVQVVRKRPDDVIQYVILKSEPEAVEEEVRYFAVPASSKHIKVSSAGEFILMVQREDLVYARKLRLNQCPRPNFHLNPTIYELSDYTSPASEV